MQRRRSFYGRSFNKESYTEKYLKLIAVMKDLSNDRCVSYTAFQLSSSRHFLKRCAE